MPTWVIFGYSASALVYDAGTNSFTLRPDYDPWRDRIRVEFSDDDPLFDGDGEAAGDDEIGSDPDQIATITTPQGVVLGSGQVYDEEYSEIAMPSGTGWLERIEIGGQHFGYMTNVPLEPGVTYPVNYMQDIKVSSDAIDYMALQSVVCFGPDVRIGTLQGARRAADLRSGDRVLTRDSPPQPILVAMSSAPPHRTALSPSDWMPVQIAAGALGPGQPLRDMLLSPDHRVLLRSARADLLFAAPEVFVSARMLVDCGLARQVAVPPGWRYIHLMCSAHQVIRADGLWSETLLTGPEALRRLRSPRRMDLVSRLGTSPLRMQAARPSLTPREAALILPRSSLKAVPHLVPAR
jgi:hypothetical protein